MVEQRVAFFALTILVLFNVLTTIEAKRVEASADRSGSAFSITKNDQQTSFEDSNESGRTKVKRQLSPASRLQQMLNEYKAIYNQFQKSKKLAI